MEPIEPNSVTSGRPAPSRGPFPSLVIRRDRLVPAGAFAESQAAFLRPDPGTVARLTRLLEAKQVGVVAHFYMDPELQGVLAASSFPHIHISDSLVMADRAVAMANAGMRAITVLGVDFMSENARAMLDEAGHRDIPVYRVAADPIGCTLAESAEAKAYGAYLTRATRSARPLHVIYINTSLRVKAKSHAVVPTITCTSSNVVKTVLSAFAEIPGVDVYFGPDTYMGANLAALFQSLLDRTDEEIRALHPAHDRHTVAALIPRFHYFEHGNCIVHHMFGRAVTDRVARYYGDAFIAAHLEVPGEMFGLAMDAARTGRGVAGSTSDILRFIESKVSLAARDNAPASVSFVLGTEAGMLTSIVRKVEGLLATARSAELEVEIVFPVADEAVATTADARLPLVPGVAAGEGCSVAGGCATCPYMKMNSLEGLFALLERIGIEADERLSAFHPRAYSERIDGKTAAELGSEPILHMRAFQTRGRLPERLIEDVRTRTRASRSS